MPVGVHAELEARPARAEPSPAAAVHATSQPDRQVQRVAARPVLARCACGGHAPAGGMCPSCAAKASPEEFEPELTALRQAAAARRTSAA
jgi:hypothetical protein